MNSIMTPALPRILHFLLGLCFLLYSPPVLAEADKGEKAVRVGYYEDGDYMRRTHSGEYVGFNFEYLQEISKFSGLTYQVVDGVSWEHTLEMLEKGEIDILPAVYYTPERAKKMLFSELPMLSLYTTLNVRADDGRYSYEDFPSFRGMKVGIIANSKDGEKFRQYCRDNGLDLIIVPYAETAGLLDALADKTLDGVAITHLGRNSIFRSVAQFSPEPMYIAVAKDRPDLLARINKAMNIIDLRDPITPCACTPSISRSARSRNPFLPSRKRRSSPRKKSSKPRMIPAGRLWNIRIPQRAALPAWWRTFSSISRARAACSLTLYRCPSRRVWKWPPRAR